MAPRQVKVEIIYDGTTKSNAATASASSESSSGGTHTVVSGDTLWAISKKYLGKGSLWKQIYDVNTDIIESTAKKHGKKSSDNGHWIWPGEVLTIPGQATTSNSATSLNEEKENPILGQKIASQLTSLSYTDPANGTSDSISLTMQDIAKEWLGPLRPPRGSSLGAKLNLISWNRDGENINFDCGSFILDDISFSGRPLTAVLSGVSVPAMDDFKSKKISKTWEKTTIKNIATEISSAASVALVFDADDISIAELEQSKETNSAFLYSLCEKYGLGMKVYNQKIVIFDYTRYEAKGSVATIAETDMLSWNHNTTIEGTYTGVEFSYSDPDSDDTISVMLGEEGRLYYMNAQASSEYDARIQAAAKLNAANREIETLDISIMANATLVASQCVNISGLSSIDGKYFIDQVKHTIGGGYKMQLTLHRVQQPITVTAPVAEASGGQSYTVVSGDTLWGIAKKFYGKGSKWNIIYEANKDVIESTAKEHGKKSSDNGHWIWPGETLTIPGES